MAALPFEHPKLAVTVQTTPEDFASRLDRAIRRSESAKVIDVEPQAQVNGHRSLAPTGPAPTPMSAPFPILRRL
jgi:hypothetical protein